MKLTYQIFLLTLFLGLTNISVNAQKSKKQDWREIEPQTVTLFSRIKYKDKFKGYGKSTFSFKHGVRSDVGREVTGNNYELTYGGISINKDTDWFGVTMVTDDRSRIKDLGKLKWSEIFEVPILTARIEPPSGIKVPEKSETFEESSNGQVTKVAVVGHMYVVHTKDATSDVYTLFRVEKLVPNDEVTISWKLVPSPEN